MSSGRFSVPPLLSRAERHDAEAAAANRDLEARREALARILRECADAAMRCRTGEDLDFVLMSLGDSLEQTRGAMGNLGEDMPRVELAMQLVRQRLSRLAVKR